MTSDSPPGCFHTLKLTASLAVNTATSSRIMEQHAETYRREHGPRSVAILRPTIRGRRTETPDDEWLRQSWRIWWEPPALWREEATLPDGPIVMILIRHDLSLSYHPARRILYTSEPAPARGWLGNLRARLFERRPVGAWPPGVACLDTVPERIAEFPLLTPRLPASEWELPTIGEESYLNRPVRRVRATRRPGSATVNAFHRSDYWSWVSEYEYLVDDALGMLLHLTGLVDGTPAATVAVDELVVDAPLSAEVFTFAPPPGTYVVHARRRS